MAERPCACVSWLPSMRIFDWQGGFSGSLREGFEHVYFVVAEDYVLLVLHV